MVKGSINSSTKVNISVNVTSTGDNAPVGNVDVTLTNTSTNNDYTGKTGSAGGCTINNVPTGNYNVVASATGYHEYNRTLTVDENTKKLNIKLTKE